jgi:hypothetical protein
VALLALPAQADTLVLQNGREINCRIKSESFAKIEYQRAGVSSTQSVDTDEVISIQYGSTSQEYREAVRLEAAGKMGEAAGFYLAASDDKDAADHQRATALMSACSALLANNNFGDASQFLGQLIKTYPNTRHLAAAQLGLGQALLRNRKLSEADTVFHQLKADVESKSLGDRWGFEASFYLLWSAEAQEKQGVVDGYNELRSKTRSNYPGIANKCALRLGRVHLAQNRVAEAEAMFEEIIKSRLDTDSEIVAGAFNGRGRCSFGRAQGTLTAGDTGRAADHFQDALLDFLRVHVSYPGIRAEQAEALFFGGQSFINLADLNIEVKDARLHGLRLLKRCQTGYAGSEWAGRAAREL